MEFGDVLRMLNAPLRPDIPNDDDEYCDRRTFDILCLYNDLREAEDSRDYKESKKPDPLQWNDKWTQKPPPETDMLLKSLIMAEFHGWTHQYENIVSQLLTSLDHTTVLAIARVGCKPSFGQHEFSNYKRRLWNASVMFIRAHGPEQPITWWLQLPPGMIFDVFNGEILAARDAEARYMLLKVLYTFALKYRYPRDDQQQMLMALRLCLGGKVRYRDFSYRRLVQVLKMAFVCDHDFVNPLAILEAMLNQA